MKTRNYNQYLPKGFTLIELLTVIAIIGILAAIIIPVTGIVRDSARKTKSLSNMRQITSTFLIYASDNKGLLPCATWSGAGGNNPSGLFWMQELSPYLGDTGTPEQSKFSVFLVDPIYEALLGFNPLEPSNFENGVDPRGGYSMNNSIGYASGINGGQYSGLGNWKFRQPISQYTEPARSVVLSMGYYEGISPGTNGSQGTARFSPAVPGNEVEHHKRIGAGNDGKDGTSAAYGFLDGSVKVLIPTDAANVLKRRTL